MSTKNFTSEVENVIKTVIKSSRNVEKFIYSHFLTLNILS